MLFTMLGITIILMLISTFSLVGSAYYSERNYKLGKVLWRISAIFGITYSIFGVVTLGMIAYKTLEFLF